MTAVWEQLIAAGSKVSSILARDGNGNTGHTHVLKICVTNEASLNLFSVSPVSKLGLVAVIAGWESMRIN